MITTIDLTDDECPLERVGRNSAAYSAFRVGGLHVQRWNTVNGIEPNYSRDEVFEVLKYSETIASLSVMGVAVLTGNSALATWALKAFEMRTGELEAPYAKANA